MAYIFMLIGVATMMSLTLIPLGILSDKTIHMKPLSETMIYVVKAFHCDGDKMTHYSALYLLHLARNGRGKNRLYLIDLTNADHITVDKLDNSNISKWCMYKDKVCVKEIYVEIIPVGSLYF